MNRPNLVSVRILAALSLVVYLGPHRAGGRPSAANASVHRPMPAFDLGTPDGRRLSSTVLSGKIALVDFWATWCGPCVEEIPEWNQLQLRYGPKRFTVLGIAVQSGWASDIQSDIEKLKVEIKYPIVIGDEKVAREFGGVLGFPTTFLVDRRGQIRKKYTGQYAGKQAEISRDIQKLLSEK